MEQYSKLVPVLLDTAGANISYMQASPVNKKQLSLVQEARVFSSARGISLTEESYCSFEDDTNRYF